MEQTRMQQARFKVGDLVVWTESAWAKHLDNKNCTDRFLAYVMPPTGFYRITEIYDLTYYVQSVESPKYERSMDALNFVYSFDLALEKHQEDAALIFALEDIGAL
jgi:hypothetical protein